MLTDGFYKQLQHSYCLQYVASPQHGFDGTKAAVQLHRDINRNGMVCRLFDRSTGRQQEPRAATQDIGRRCMAAGVDKRAGPASWQPLGAADVSICRCCEWPHQAAARLQPGDCLLKVACRHYKSAITAYSRTSMSETLHNRNAPTTGTDFALELSLPI